MARLRIFFAALIVAAVAGLSAQALADRNEPAPVIPAPPPMPAWVDPVTGLVDEDRLPDTIGALDCEGNVIAYLPGSVLAGEGGAPWMPTHPDGSPCVVPIAPSPLSK